MVIGIKNQSVVRKNYAFCPALGCSAGVDIAFGIKPSFRLRQKPLVVAEPVPSDGAAGRKILKPAALPAEFPRLFLCYEICGEMSEKVDVQSNFITGTVFAAFFHRR